MARGWKAVPQRVPDQETLAPATQQAVSAPSETRRAFAQMLGGIAFLLATTPVAAQSGALVFQLGGAFMPKFDVSDTRDEIGGGIAATGGIVAQLGPNFAIRGAASSLVTSLTGDSVSVSDRGVRRTFLMGDLIFGIPTPIGSRPYFFGGAGRVTLDPEQAGEATAKNLVFRFGTGLNYLVEPSNLVLSVEVSGVLYRFSALGFDKYTAGAAIAVGAAFAFPL